MNSFRSSMNPIVTCSALVTAVGMATAASAIDKNWLCQTNSPWSTPSCWSPAFQPAATDDVNIGNVAGVQNSSVPLDQNASVNTLDITDGMTFRTNGHTFEVNLLAQVSGHNTVGDASFPSRILVEQIVNGPEFSTPILSVLNGARVELAGGGLFIESSMNIDADSSLRGAGTADFDSNTRNLVNDGTIAPSGALTFRQAGTGTFDIDGISGGGTLDLTIASNSTLTFEGDRIFDAFGGTLSMVRGTRLDMDLADPWIVESSGDFNIYGSGIGGPARVTGSPLTFNGTMNLYSGSQFSLDVDVTFDTSAELVTGLDAVIDVTSDAVVNGGLYIINQGSSLNFDGPTEIGGGSFITHSDDAADGAVDFNGATTWAGNISIAGIARQNGPAHVTATSIITGDTFDMDGTDATNWDVDASLILNVDRIDFSGNNFNTTIDVGGNGRISVNLTDPADGWGMAGTMNMAGNSLLFGTRIGGNSTVHLRGIVNVSGKNDITAEAIVESTTTINIAAATSALRMMSSSVVGAGVTFTGDGMLQNGGVGSMTINSGLNTGSVGFANAGLLRVGSGAGIMSVDRFQTTGVWNVDIGGPNAGTQHDRVVSNGPASVGGTLEVDLINGFVPVVGDQFTILNAVGGVSGSFVPNVTTTAGAATYHWDVLIGGADVVLRLASIDTACSADFNHDGFINSQDFFDFLVPFFDSNPAADFNADTFINSQDFFDFLTAFFGGC